LNNVQLQGRINKQKDKQECRARAWDWRARGSPGNGRRLAKKKKDGKQKKEKKIEKIEKKKEIKNNSN